MCNIVAIILAAGEGSRIGMPKWQLEYEGKNFLEIIVDKLNSTLINNVICVVNGQAIPQINYSDIVINSQPEDGMLSSIYCGIQYSLKRLASTNGYLIYPVDHPYVAVSTLLDLKNEFSNVVKKYDCVKSRSNCNFTITPCFKGISGHPIIISSSLAEKITPNNFSIGFKKFLRSQKKDVYRIDVRR